MKKDIRDEWLSRLRSGKYEKGKGYLCCEDNYCCLGVLADQLGILVSADPIVGPKKGILDDDLEYKGIKFDSLPDKVAEDLGLSSMDLHNLITINDRSNTFEPVIAWIEENIEAE